MIFHEILGIKESSSETDIEQAFRAKWNALEVCKDELGCEAYSIKERELLSAKQECLRWTEVATASRIHERVAYKNRSVEPLRMICCGPCTFFNYCIDDVCYSKSLCGQCGVCCENSCSNCCGDAPVPNTVSLLFDIAMYSLGLWLLLRGIVSDNANKRIGKLQERINSLEVQKRENAELIEKTKREYETQKQQLTFVTAFCKLFESIKTSETSIIIFLQTCNVEAVEREYQKLSQRQTEILTELDECHRMISSRLKRVKH